VIVVDASVVVTAVVDDGVQGDAVRDRLRGQRLLAPELLDVEVLSALRGLERSGRAGSPRATDAITDLADLPIERCPHRDLLARIWQLRDNVTCYDAAYLALAEAAGAVLLTADRKLAGVPGITCEVEVLESDPGRSDPV
jgi:predicted nucleic acid-binding protein